MALRWLAGFLLASSVPVPVGAAEYPKRILSSGQLDVTVYLPGSLGYYNSTRFDWASMIGSITLAHREFFSDLWRTPADPNWGKDHDPTNPEGVLGLASEFGCGGDGPECPAGWGGKEEVSNGLLGYHEAGLGEAFLKIGVGKLVKGSCDSCESGDTNYHFNSRYDFAEVPQWTVTHPSSDVVEMVHAATLGPWGYRLKRRLQVHGDMLEMRSELTNIGSKAFSTVQYTHNFLTFDGRRIGPPFTLQFGQDLSSYHEPGIQQGWSVPIASRFNLAAPNLWTSTGHLPIGGERQSILTQFQGELNENASSSYIADSGYGPAVASLTTGSLQQQLYGYKFFAQVTAACPEPLQQLALLPGESATWEQRLAFSVHGAGPALSRFFTGVDGESGGSNQQCMGGSERLRANDAKVVTTLTDCMTQCLLRLNCKGVEYSDSKTCDVLVGGTLSSREKTGYYCLKLDLPEHQLLI